MMDLDWTIHHTPRDSSILLSPRPVNLSHFEGFPSIKQIRRSLSRSPSKPQRYSLFASRTDRMHSSLQIVSLPLQRTHSALTADEFTPRQRYPIKRSIQSRPLPRKQSPSAPLRRALSDNTNCANTKYELVDKVIASSPVHLEKENQQRQEIQRATENFATAQVVRADTLTMDKILRPIASEHLVPLRSSPLKRSDGVMNLEAASSGSPRHKRRSLHNNSIAPDFSIFDQTSEVLNEKMAEMDDSREADVRTMNSSTWPHYGLNSPQRRPFGLRKSTLQQRSSLGRVKPPLDSSREVPGQPTLTRARSRLSLSSTLPLRGVNMDCTDGPSDIFDGPLFPTPAIARSSQSAPKPHPLSNILSPSTCNIDMTHNSQHASVPGDDTRSTVSHVFAPSLAHSLPVGTVRGMDGVATVACHGPEGAFNTPTNYKTARPLPQAFMSTGLISKRNRNVEVDASTGFGNSLMPDTPSKKATHLNLDSPTQPPLTLGRAIQPVHEFGSPSTPFNARMSKASHESFGKSAGIFGTTVGSQLTRRGSFLSIDGDDISDSPINPLESHINCEEMPPTPTKPMANALSRMQSRGKSNSLRSSLFGRRRSLCAETFPPAGDDTSVQEDEQRGAHANTQEDANERQSTPQTPHETLQSCTPSGTSSIPASAERKPPTALRSGEFSFTPATPTGPKESLGGAGQSSSTFFSNEVDTSLTTRFDCVSTFGIGEFSHVYRVEKWQQHSRDARGASNVPVKVWAVKKSRRPYTGNKDRQRKLREVDVLKALRGQDHIIELVDDWEWKSHLYIQTAFCDNGNLKDFLTSTGFKGRLDDFRIWKILLELSQGIDSIHTACFIHLDLKPANVFIDWEGVLKIGDFGMASVWPAPADLDGEGDREYIGPEVLAGHFDKPADIFALGMIMLEIAGNIVLPDNGSSWQRLRAGDLSDLPSLTWSSESSLMRDAVGNPIERSDDAWSDTASCSAMMQDDLSFLKPNHSYRGERTHDLSRPPNFMVDCTDKEALDQIVQWMINPNPEARPSVDQLLHTQGVEWVSKRRRAGATIYEGNWGPAEEVSTDRDVDMLDI